MFDKEGFRYGVGIMLVNAKRHVLWAKRRGMNAWQFPQGGIQEPETPLQTMYRELHEEIGLEPHQVMVLGHTRRWLRYRLPRRLMRHYSKPLCIGQKQKWFLLKLIGNDSDINLNCTDSPEFDAWQWVPYWHPLREIVLFKRRVYSMALKEFGKIVLSKRFQETDEGSPNERQT